MLAPGNHGKDVPLTWPHSFDEVLARSPVIYPSTPAVRSLRLDGPRNGKTI